MTSPIPDFWPLSIQAINPTIAYEGTFPERSRDYYALVPAASNLAYVYVLLDDAGDPVYIGRSHRPGNRFDKHRRKPWWPAVKSLSLLRVQGDSRGDTHAAVSYLERYLIKTYRPTYNIAGVR